MLQIPGPETLARSRAREQHLPVVANLDVHLQMPWALCRRLLTRSPSDLPVVGWT